MANKGFYIKSVVAKGELVQDSQINFVKGCNVVYGPSDTGKTSLYSVIEFLLGKSSNPNSFKSKSIRIPSFSSIV